MFYIDVENGIAYTVPRNSTGEVEVDDDIANLHLYGLCADETVHEILDTTHGLLTKLARGDN